MSVRYDKRGSVPLLPDRAPRPTARQMDEALQRGGELQALAQALGTTAGELRQHIKRRMATGRWRWVSTAFRIGGPRGVISTAGRLREVKERKAK